MIGDPALDFVGLLADCGAEFAERALSSCAGEVDATFRRRMQFYLRATPFHEILFGAATGLEEHVRQGLAGVRRTLS